MYKILCHSPERPFALSARSDVPRGDYTLDHTASTCLMDARGGFQNMIGHHESDDAALAKLKQLVGRAQNFRGIS